MLRRTWLVLAAAVPLTIPLTTGAALATPAPAVPTVTTIHVAGGASIVAADPASARVFSGNGNDDRITFLNGRADTVRATGHGPCCGEYGLAFDPRTNTVYAAGIDDNLYAIDARTHQIRTAIDVASRDNGLGSPGAVAVDPSAGNVFVLSVYDNVVTVVSASTDKVTRTFPLPDQPVAVAADPTRHLISFAAGQTVTVVDARTAKVLRTVDIGRFAWDITVDQTTGLAYAASGDDNTLTTVDTVTGMVVRRTKVGASTGNSLLSVSADPRTHRVFVASYDAHQVVVVDGTSGPGDSPRRRRRRPRRRRGRRPDRQGLRRRRLGDGPRRHALTSAVR